MHGMNLQRDSILIVADDNSQLISEIISTQMRVEKNSGTNHPSNSTDQSFPK